MEYDDPSHRTRYSDSSMYDEVCIWCGATDARSDRRLKSPCPCVPEEVKRERSQQHPCA